MEHQVYLIAELSGKSRVLEEVYSRDNDGWAPWISTATGKKVERSMGVDPYPLRGEFYTPKPTIPESVSVGQVLKRHGGPDLVVLGQSSQLLYPMCCMVLDEGRFIGTYDADEIDWEATEITWVSSYLNVVSGSNKPVPTGA